jgi:spore germination protein GerM
MTRSNAIGGAALALVAVLLAWLLFVGLPRWYATARAPQAAAPPAEAAAPGEPERKIKARLFYIAEDGRNLTSIEREVAYGADPGAQARAILEAQIEPAAEPLLSAVPAGTRLRAVFVANGEAYVDVTGEMVSAHPGGSLNELLTVYTIVGALTANLPAVNAVQILVDGKEVDTLTGHVDLRQPLTRNPEWVQ